MLIGLRRLAVGIGSIHARYSSRQDGIQLSCFLDVVTARSRHRRSREGVERRVASCKTKIVVWKSNWRIPVMILFAIPGAAELNGMSCMLPGYRIGDVKDWVIVTNR